MTPSGPWSYLMSIFREMIRKMAWTMAPEYRDAIAKMARVTQELLRVKYENLGDFGGTDPVEDSYFLEVAGPTFEYKDTLKSLGLRWEPRSKTWRLDATLYRYNSRARAIAWDRARKLQKAAIPVLSQLAKEHNEKANLANKALRPEKDTKDFIQMIQRQERLRERLEASGLVVQWKVPNKYEVSESKVVVTGNTYPYVALMKKYGFKWDPSVKGWWMPGPEYHTVGDKWMGEIIRTLPQVEPDTTTYTSVFSEMSDRDLTTFLKPVVDQSYEDNEGWDGERSWGEEMARLKLVTRRMNPKEQTKFYDEIKGGHYRRASGEGNMNDGTSQVRLSELRAARTEKKAAVAKIPLFGKGKFETTALAEDVGKLVQKYYHGAVLGSLKFDTKVSGRPDYGLYVGFTMDNSDPKDPVLTGSINTALEPWPQGVRAFAYIRIDG